MDVTTARAGWLARGGRLLHSRGCFSSLPFSSFLPTIFAIHLSSINKCTILALAFPLSIHWFSFFDLPFPTSIILLLSLPTPGSPLVHLSAFPPITPSPHHHPLPLDPISLPCRFLSSIQYPSLVPSDYSDSFPLFMFSHT